MNRAPLQLTRFQALRDAPRLLKNPLPVMRGYLGRSDGFYQTFLGKIPTIVTDRLDVSLHVLKSNHQNYIKPPKVYGLLARYLGNGILTSDGERWKSHRKMLQPGFTPKRIQGLATTMLHETNTTLDTLSQLDEPVDWRAETLDLTSRIITRTIFGADLSLEEVHCLRSTISSSQKLIVSQLRFPPSAKWFALTGEEKRCQERLASAKRDWLKRIAQRRGQEPKNDLLQTLIDARYADSNEGLSNDDLLDETITFFVAGHETSSHALAWFVYEIGQRPELQQRLREELRSVCGKEDVQWDQIPRLKLLESTLKETLRLHPPAWIVDREALDDEVNGCHIQKDKMVAICLYSLLRRADIWNQPDEFQSERFLELHESHEAWLPFGAGPRKCIGQHFAMMEMLIVLAQLINRYRFEVMNAEKIRPKVMVTMGLDRPLMVRFKEAT